MPTRLSLAALILAAALPVMVAAFGALALGKIASGVRDAYGEASAPFSGPSS